MVSYPFTQINLVLREPELANLADNFKVAFALVKSIFKNSIKYKKLQIIYQNGICVFIS